MQKGRFFYAFMKKNMENEKKDNFFFESIIFIAYICFQINNKCFITKKNKTMNKTQLIDSIAAKAGLSKVDSKKALDAFMDSVAEALKAGDKVALVGFGSFSVSQRSARTGINPATKKPIKIAAKKVVKFKAGAELSELK